MKLSEEFVKDLAEQVSAGCISVPALLKKNGVHRNTGMHWRNHGNKLLEKFDYDREKTLNNIYANVPKADRQYAIGCVMFVTDLPKALAVLQNKLEKVVLDEGLREPKMALNILERIAPKQWAKRVQIDGKIEENHTITQIVIHGGSEEVKQLEEPIATDAEFEDI